MIKKDDDKTKEDKTKTVKPKKRVKTDIKKDEKSTVKKTVKKKTIKKIKTKITKKKKKVVLKRGKRKEAVARAIIKQGKGRFRINKINIKAIANSYLREIMNEPLHILPEIAQNIDVSVTVRGGGPVGQAQAVSSAVARAIVEYTGDEQIKSMFIKRNRFIFVEDSRRVEPKKYLGPKARARRQKSYR